MSLAAIVHFNIRAGSTFLVPVCTVPHGHWVNKADNQQVRLYASYRCRFTFTKGAEVRDVKMIELPALTNWFLKYKDQDHDIFPVYLEMQTQV